MIYRRRYPEVVEAFRFGIQHEPSWFTDAVKEGRLVITNLGKPVELRKAILNCTNLMASYGLIASYGDYIINGNLYMWVCSANTFEMNYEVME